MIQPKSGKDYSAHRFLIADDKQFLRNLIQNMLVRCHAGDIRHAKDGASAIEALAEADGDIDCVLCDWNMEPINGLELLRSIRAGNVEHTPRDLCFVMLTGYGDESVVKAAMDLDINGYVVKPVSMDRLLQAIDAAFARSVTLKPKELYQSKGTIVLPGTLPVSGKRIPPWVLLSTMHQETKEAMSRRLEQIRCERNDALEGVRSLESSIINEVYMTVDRVVPGKVLAEHIYTEGGRLLLSKGTILTESLLERLRDLAVVSHDSVRLMVGDSGN